MENASKALIIAGAILLAIAIIGIGMYVFSSASSQVSDADLSKEQIETFNSKFERFEGNQSGKQVKLLFDTIRTHNLANPDSKIFVRATGDSKGSDPTDYWSEYKTRVKDNLTYNIKFKYSTSGLIEGVYESNNGKMMFSDT